VKTTDDGGPAFPVPMHDDGNGKAIVRQGMTLRDWFAGQAMAAMVGTYRTTMRGVDDAQDDSEADTCGPNRDLLFDQNGVTGEYEGATEVATDAYIIADAMLAARKTHT
jgi:hypothetical protein